MATTPYVQLPETWSNTSFESLPGSSQGVLTLSDTNERSTLASLTSIEVNNSSSVSVGDVFIRQTVVSEEVVKARFLCLQFESAVSMRRFRCSLAVFLCWSLIVASSVVVYIFIFLIPQPQTRMEIDLTAPWYIRRMEWLSKSHHDPEFLRLPIQQVLIQHSESEYCDVKNTCSLMMISIQDSQLRRGFPDIGANYLVGGNGWVFEGTGANVRSFLKLGWDGDDISIIIMFIGNYAKDKPDQKQIDHVIILLDLLVRSGVLSENYELYGSCQVDYYTDNPGPKLMKRLHLFSHWNSTNESECLPGLPY